MGKLILQLLWLFWLKASITHSSFLASSTESFRVVILAWNRPNSLLRLIRSLERSDYSFQDNNPYWDIMVEIRVDGGGGTEGKKVRKIAQEWSCVFGNKSVVVSPTNLGLVGSWRNAWTWRDKELFIILDDDAEISFFQMVSSYQLPKLALCVFLVVCFLMVLLYTNSTNSTKSEAWLTKNGQDGNGEYMQLYRAQDQVIVDEIRNKNVDKMSEKDAMEFFYRVIAMPQQGICRSLKRVGGKWTNSIGVDGDKFVCMDTFVDGSECLVYSFGIANDWTFEDFIVKFGCSVFAYDPTVNFPSKRGDYIHFEKKGLAEFFSSNMNTLRNFQKHNGHLTKTIKYLKIDIESHELEGLPEWLSSGALEAVEQLAMEIHLTKLHEGPKFKGLVSILQELYKLNFRLISYQVNLVARTMRDNHYTLMEVVFMKDTVWNHER